MRKCWSSAATSKLRSEIDFLATELGRSLGLTGLASSRSPQIERARVSVTRVIRSAIDRIRGGDDEIGGYLAATVKTGTFCSYVPDPRLPIDWDL